MQNLHLKLIQKYQIYHNWHQTKHHNKIHWGVLVVFTLLIFGTISRWTPISFAADIVPPTAPINLTATAISSSQINLSWTASTDNAGVTGYKIYRCAGSTCTPTVQIATAPSNSYSDIGLTASTAYTYAVSAYDTAGNESGKSGSVNGTTQALPISTNLIDNLKPGEWYEVPNSHLRDVAAVPTPEGWEGVAGVINAWSGGAYDTKRDRLIVWGGGHMSYAGNEIYAFDLNTLKWERVNEPSTDIDTDGSLEWTGEYADGTPRARHTYNYIQYVASIDRFCTFGDTAMYPGGQISTDKTRCFDFNTNQWEKMANTPSYGVGTFSSVDSVTGHAWVRGNGNYRYLSEFDPINNLWTKRTNLESISSMFNWTADIDPVRRKFVAIGGGAVFSWDIGTSGIITRQELITTGATEIINARDPGFAYDLVSDKFVAWNGGADVYTLDMDTLVWTKHAPATTNAVIPTAPAQWGTYGRFRYSPNKNAFVVVNSVDQNVYIYKLSQGGGVPQDTTPPTLSSGSPIGALPSGTTQTTLSVSTDENATCKYGTTANTAYASIANTFITTGGISHSQTITGLTSGTSYSYYIRCQDTAGNANPTDYAISFSVGISVTETNSITIKEREGKNTTNYPIQFGRPFVQGEIANYPQALIDGIAVETQSNVKSRWSDGSVKHAIISFLIPNLAANTSVRVTFRDQPSGNNDNFVTKEMMLSDNYDFDAAIELTNGLTKAVSARAMLNADAFEYWLKGPIATTVILADHSSARSFDTGFDENRSFRPIFHATFWPGIKKVKIRFIGEIANTEVLQDQTYALSLKTGQQSPETVYTKPVFTHYGNARWTKVFWIGGAPSKVGIDHNLAYLAKTKSIPNYDLNKKVSEAAITDAYSKWTAAPKDIFDSGNWTKYMPTTGGRPEIGMYPTWTVRWLYTGDNRMEEQALGNADLSAAWPVHFREGKETKKFLRNNSVISGLGKVLSVSDRPTINLSDFSFARTVTADKIIPVGLLTKGGWIADNAHQSDPVSPQYILTGDYWYLEELYFWSSWSAANTSGVAITEPWGRGPTGREGGIYDQVRGEAWMLRNRAHTAFVSPDSAPEKEYFTTLIHDALAIWEGERNIRTTPFFGNANWNWGASIKRPALGDPPLHHWDKGETGKAQEGEIDSNATYAAISTWNQNAMLMSLGRAKELGYSADALLSYLAFNLIGQLTHPDYNPYLVATYRHPTKRLSDFQFFPTWSELKTGYKSEAQVLASFRLTDAEQGYDFIALAAASMVTGEPGGTDAWQFMEKEALSAGVLNDNPKWAIVPRDTGVSFPLDTTSPTTSTNLTATAVSSSQINLSWFTSTDNIGVTGYKIYRCAGSVCTPTTQIATSATNSYSDTGLTSSTAYTYAVSAYDAARNESGKSTTASATTLSQFKQADFNKDGIVNQLDFDILKQEWTRTDKPSSDLNQDGIVDARDLGIMMGEWAR